MRARDFHSRSSPDSRHDIGKPKSKVGEDLADIVATGAKDSEDGVSGRAFEDASAEAAIGFHMADFRLDGAATAQIGDELWCQATPCAADQDAGFGLSVTAVAAIGLVA